ncbi:MAG: DUF1059 domain-containing protein, partial [Gemmatimonadota bacterium]
MLLSISCRELGMDCLFSFEGETETTVIESLIRHVQTEHEEEEWFDLEAIPREDLRGPVGRLPC